MIKADKRKQQGFTLIEILVVIIVVGIISASVLPKFIDFQADAKNAALESVLTTMEGAAEMVYRKAIVAGINNITSGAVRINDGNDLNVVFGYPRVNETDWQRLISLNTDNNYNYTTIGTNLLISLKDSATPSTETAQCAIRYAPPLASGAEKTLQLNYCE